MVDVTSRFHSLTRVVNYKRFLVMTRSLAGERGHEQQTNPTTAAIITAWITPFLAKHRRVVERRETC
jgi:hypothetical protein